MTNSSRPSEEQVPVNKTSLPDFAKKLLAPPELSLMNAAFLECVPEIASQTSADTPRIATSVIPDHWVKALANIATNAWRARKRLSMSEAGGGSDASLLTRHISGVVESLKELGVEIEDWTASVYDPGLPLRVVSFEPNSELSRDSITETIKPSVKLRGQLIQIGEVIVGTPSTQPQS